MAEAKKHKKKVRSPEDKKAIDIRLNRIIGQLNGVKKMVEDDRYCDDLLVQLAAVYKATKGLAAYIFEEHLNSCIVESIKSGDVGVVNEIIDLFKRYD